MLMAGEEGSRVMMWVTWRSGRKSPKKLATLASYLGLLTPVFFACSTNARDSLVPRPHTMSSRFFVWGLGTRLCEGRPGNLTESRAMLYLHMWRSGTFLLYSIKQLSESKKRHQDCLMSSAQSFYSPCSRSVAHSLTCIFFGNVPLLHMSRYVTARDSVLPGLRLC